MLKIWIHVSIISEATDLLESTWSHMGQAASLLRILLASSVPINTIKETMPMHQFYKFESKDTDKTAESQNCCMPKDTQDVPTSGGNSSPFQFSPARIASHLSLQILSPISSISWDVKDHEAGAQTNIWASIYEKFTFHFGVFDNYTMISYSGQDTTSSIRKSIAMINYILQQCLEMSLINSGVGNWSKVGIRQHIRLMWEIWQRLRYKLEEWLQLEIVQVQQET